jgi:hypothetical protein
MAKRYPVEQRERAVKVVLDRLQEYRSVDAACQSIGPKVGVVRNRCADGCCRPRSMPPSGQVPQRISSRVENPQPPTDA